MTQSRPHQSSAVQLWLVAIAVSLTGVSLVLGLGTLTPLFLEESVAGAGVRLVVAAICFAVFITVDRQGLHFRRRVVGH